MKPLNLAILGLLLLVGSLLPAQQPFHSPHADQLREVQALPWQSEREWDQHWNIVQNAPKGTSACNLTKKVYGWHPYWMGTAYNNYDFNLLSTFSYFSYEVVPSTGNYSSIHSWKTTASVTQAQANGCKVELCATLFGGTNNTTFLTNPTAQQTFIDSIITLVQFRNANGVNIDFEGIPGSQRANFTAFMQNLSVQLKTAIPGAELSMALYAVDWNNVFDMPGLDPYVDQFIIMGYGYYYSGSATAGPTAPMYSGSIWWSYNLNRSILYYLGQGVTADKLLIGLPYYGNEYNTNASTYPTASTGHVGARTYSYAKNNYEGTYPKTYDNHSQTAAYIFQVGTQWRQCWVEDEQSLGEKFDLVHHRNIGGMGIWALGYDNGYSDLWDLIRDKFTDCRNYCSDTIYDTGGPLGSYLRNEDYSFTVQSPAGQQVEASFLAFDVELNYDYVYVHDGISTAAPLIGTYTGTTLPPTLQSTGDALTFRFTSDGATETPGFELAWGCIGPPVHPDTIYLDHSDSALLNCALTEHIFYDSDTGVSGDYGNSENNQMTFCNPNSAESVRLTFDMQTAPVQLDLKSTVNGNDYLRIFDGPDTTSNLVAVYTGSTNSYPQPGTIISNGQCLTVAFDSDAGSTGQGWEARIRCNSRPATLAGGTVSSSATQLFQDTGGGVANYGNNENYIVTWCPDAGASAAGEVLRANFGPVEIEQNYDYLHVYDGASTNDRLIATFTGNNLNQNDLQTIIATEDNPSGCLTFQFYSDGATTQSGWSATLSTGAPRKAYGAEACTNATLINVAGQPYAGSTTLATGLPNAEDPPLNIELLTLPQCSGANAITRLENSIWYKFQTPSTTCSNSQIDLELQNISCQNSIPGGNGAQIAIYASSTCQNGASWGSPIYCADKLLQGVPVNIAGLLSPSTTYYILIDGFAGQHCNLDLTLIGDIDGCILPIELVDFQAEALPGNRSARLDWHTAGEENNDGFFVERAIGSPADFQTIGFVSSSPNPGGNGQYSFQDNEFQAGTTTFYRLRQLDLDGAEHYHRIVELSPKNGDNFPSVYPNPFQDQLVLEVPGKVTFSIFDLQGKLWFEQEYESGTHKIRLEELPKGVFFYQIRGEEPQSGKVVHE